MTFFLNWKLRHHAAFSQFRNSRIVGFVFLQIIQYVNYINLNSDGWMPHIVFGEGVIGWCGYMKHPKGLEIDSHVIIRIIFLIDLNMLIYLFDWRKTMYSLHNLQVVYVARCFKPFLIQTFLGKIILYRATTYSLPIYICTYSSFLSGTPKTAYLSSVSNAVERNL